MYIAQSGSVTVTFTSSVREALGSIPSGAIFVYYTFPLLIWIKTFRRLELAL